MVGLAKSYSGASGENEITVQFSSIKMIVELILLFITIGGVF